MDKPDFRVIAHKNLPYRLPIWPTAIIYLLADKVQPDNFWWGVITVFLVSWWAVAIYVLWVQKPVDLIKAIEGQ